MITKESKYWHDYARIQSKDMSQSDQIKDKQYFYTEIMQYCLVHDDI